MDRLTLCITGVFLASTAAACRGGEPAEKDRSGDEASGSGGAGGNADTTHPSSSTGTEGDAGVWRVCPDRPQMTVGSHVVIHVRWPASLAIKAGTGELHVWTKADLILDKGTLTGSARPCGSVIPALTKTDVVGGGMVQVRIPDAVWDAPSMPVFQVRGRLGGSRVGAAISMEPVASLVGCTMGDPMSDPWPPSAADLDAVDDDGDGQPGIKGVPRKDAPYSEPPLDLGGVLDPHGKRADEVYLATRTILSLAGTRDSCSTATGTADVTSVDSHVVGCHVRGDGICTRSQSDFVDGAQPAFTIESGTFEMVEVPATATCEDVRAALP